MAEDSTPEKEEQKQLARPAETAVEVSKPAPPPVEEDDQEDEGMLRMSFLDHLEELRTRLIRIVLGVVVAFGLCIYFTNDLWNAVRQPAAAALTQLGYKPDLAALTPTEAFSIVWIKLPLLAALFVAAPWVLYQVWAFIAPGLYKRERRWATPFIFVCSALFILGGLFAYFVAFRFGLVFLLGISGPEVGITPVISITEYFDLFVNVILGVAIVFELPVLIFFLALLRVVTPSFLLRHSRYAILLIVIAAAIITPTPDVVNLTIFAAPMILLYFLGVFGAYLLELSREGKRVWPIVVLVAISLILVGSAGSIWMLVAKRGYHFIQNWPFLVR